MKIFRLVFRIAVIAAVIYFIAINIGTFANILIVLIGFGAVILVHEFGHFLLAKLSGINVQAFSIGFPPTLLGIKRTGCGYRLRILPRFFPADDETDQTEDDERGRLKFTFGKNKKPGETEYQFGLIPLGGFVKMLGQEDVGSPEATDDPRSYANKPVISRMGVIAAGVVFNVISAVIVFMIVFLIGIHRVPPVVGGVLEDSAADKAGLQAGDRIVTINGKANTLEFINISLCGALSAPKEEVTFKIEHSDGRTETVDLQAEDIKGRQMRGFGIEMPLSLTIDKVAKKDTEELYEETGLKPGDTIRQISGRKVDTYWQMESLLENIYADSVNVVVERAGGELVETELDLSLALGRRSAVGQEAELFHICSMVPRLKITDVNPREPSLPERILAMFRSLFGKEEESEPEPGLQKGDIILAAADVNNPTFTEMREVTRLYEDRKLPIQVLRNDSKRLTIETTPQRAPDSNEVKIGIGLALDAAHPVVADTIDPQQAPEALEIPRGARITRLDDQEVSDFYEIINYLQNHVGQRVAVSYRLNEMQAGSTVLKQDWDRKLINVNSDFADAIPFKPLEELYQADGPVEAIVMGYHKTATFVGQTYMTLRRLLGGSLSPKHLMGPVGIVTVSYTIVSQKPLIEYVYLMGLISAAIAVFNFLPLIPLDGGWFVLLIVEKIKGSAVNQRAQALLAYVGWAIILSLVLYVSFNDVVRSWF